MTKAQKAAILLFTLVLAGGLAFWLVSRQEKEVIIFAIHDGGFSDTRAPSDIRMSFYSDSTYRIRFETMYDTLAVKDVKGTYSLKKDDLYFTGWLDSVGIKKAIIRNNVIEFQDSDMDGFRIIDTRLNLQPEISPEKYPGYILYTYKPGDAAYFSPGSRPYLLQEKDMEKLMDLLETCPEDKCKAYKKQEYLKKCQAVLNPDGEIEVVILFQPKTGVGYESSDPHCYRPALVNLTRRECRIVFCFGG